MTNSSNYRAELLQERFAMKVANRLSDGSDVLGHDISERLRHMRIQAVARRKQVQIEIQPAALWAPSGASAILGGPARGPSAWQRMGMVLPILALLVGLVAIDRLLDDKAAQDLALVDAALLVDDLPPAAYADPGFLQFLRVQQAAIR